MSQEKIQVENIKAVTEDSQINETAKSAKKKKRPQPRDAPKSKKTLKIGPTKTSNEKSSKKRNSKNFKPVRGKGKKSEETVNYPEAKAHDDGLKKGAKSVESFRKPLNEFSSRVTISTRPDSELFSGGETSLGYLEDDDDSEMADHRRHSRRMTDQSLYVESGSDDSFERQNMLKTFVVPTVSSLSLGVSPSWAFFGDSLETDDEEELSLQEAIEEYGEEIGCESLGETSVSDLVWESEYSDESSEETVKFEPENVDSLFTPTSTRRSEMKSVLSFPLEPPIPPERERFEHETKLIIRDFLNTLLDKVEDKCLYVDPKKTLRKSLDKYALAVKLAQQVHDLAVLEKTCLFLARKSVEFYRRKRSFSFVTEEPMDLLEERKEQLQKLLEKLDLAMGQEEVIKENYVRIVSELEKANEVQTAESQQKLQDFEDLVRATLMRDNSERISQAIDQQMDKMQAMREKISEVRLVLINAQHCVTLLRQKTEALEDLGNGLKMRDFDHLQTQAAALGKRVEDRNSELKRLRNGYHVNLHSVIHLQEEKLKLKNRMSFRRASLYNLSEEKLRGRRRLIKLKRQQIALRKQIRDLSFQGGLLDKPYLMHDYDDSIERIEKLHTKIQQLKAIYFDLELKIEHSERLSAISS